MCILIRCEWRRAGSGQTFWSSGKRELRPAVISGRVLNVGALAFEGELSPSFSRLSNLFFKSLGDLSNLNPRHNSLYRAPFISCPSRHPSLVFLLSKLALNTDLKEARLSDATSHAKNSDISPISRENLWCFSHFSEKLLHMGCRRSIVGPVRRHQADALRGSVIRNCSWSIIGSAFLIWPGGISTGVRR
jgi:hypothetical protein